MLLRLLFFILCHASAYVWEKRCVDCKYGLEKKIERNHDTTLGSTVYECQYLCSKKEHCFAIQFGTGPHQGECEFLIGETNPTGVADFSFKPERHWDIYDRIVGGYTNTVWRPLCTECLFLHNFEYHPVQTFVINYLTFDECKTMALEKSANVIEYSKIEAEAICRIKWGGNIWSGAGPRTTVKNDKFNAYILENPYFEGCYNDKPGQNVFPKVMPGVTRRDCDPACSKAGYRYYGLRDNVCHCGSTDDHAKLTMWNATPRPEGDKSLGCTLDVAGALNVTSDAILVYNVMVHDRPDAKLGRRRRAVPEKNGIVAHMVWEKRCHNCEINGRKTESPETATKLSDCQSLCEQNPACYGIHFGTGTGVKTGGKQYAGLCYLEVLDSGLVHDGTPTNNYTEAVNFDFYNLVKEGRESTAWRLLCENCVYDHEYKFSEIEFVEHSNVSSLELCQMMGREGSHLIAEYNSKTLMCRLKWGGNIWGGAGPRTTKPATDVDTYALIDPYYMGCFRDSSSSKDGKSMRAMYPKGSLTLRQCDEACSLDGYMYYALQAVSECYCAHDAREYDRYGHWNQAVEYPNEAETLKHRQSWLGCTTDLRRSPFSPYWSRDANEVGQEGVQTWRWWEEKDKSGHLVYKDGMWWMGDYVNSVFRVTNPTSLLWEKRCTDCELIIKDRGLALEGVHTVTDCKRVCEDDRACFGFLFDTQLRNEGSNDTYSYEVNSKIDRCYIQRHDSNRPIEGQAVYDYIEKKGYDFYNLVQDGARNQFWTMLCSSCIYEHDYPFHPIESLRVENVSLDDCKKIGMDMSANVMEFTIDQLTPHCNLKWGGNYQVGSGIRSTKESQHYNSYVLGDPYYVGCFIDKEGDRAMTFVGMFGHRECDMECSRLGFNFMGLQGNNECYCSSDVGFKKHGPWNPAWEDVEAKDARLPTRGQAYEKDYSWDGCTPGLRKSSSNPLWMTQILDMWSNDTVHAWEWMATQNMIWSHATWANAVYILAHYPSSGPLDPDDDINDIPGSCDPSVKHCMKCSLTCQTRCVECEYGFSTDVSGICVDSSKKILLRL